MFVVAKEVLFDNISSQKIVDTLRTLPNLRILELEKMTLDGECLFDLFSVFRLIELSFINCVVCNGFLQFELRSLASNWLMEKLELRNCLLAHTRACLRVAVEVIRAMRRLTTLSVRDNAISEGATFLVGLLRENTGIRSFDVSSNNIDPITLEAIIDACAANNNLERLAVGRNFLSNECVHALNSLLSSGSNSNLQSLDVESKQNRIVYGVTTMGDNM